MCRRLSALRSHRWLWLVFLLLPFLIGFAIAYLITSQHVVAEPRDTPAAAPETRRPKPHGPPNEPGPEPGRATDHNRVRASITASAVGACARTADFGRRFAALAKLVATTQQAVDRRATERANELDRDCARTLAALLTDYPRAGERTLAILTHAEPGPTAGQFVAAIELLRGECRRRHDPAELVAAILERLHGHGPLGRLGTFLATGPWLDERHEGAVAGLTAIAESTPARQPLAIALLRATWRGIERREINTADQLTERAMRLLHTGNRCERVVACERVLRDDRRRPAALAWIRHTGDPDLVRQLAASVASDLHPTAAATTLRQLAVAGTDLTAAWMTLGGRASTALVDGYFECLADGQGTTTRREIMTGLGVATPTNEVRTTLEHAVDFDPNPDVRLRALLSASAIAPGHCEATCHRVLDQPSTTANPERLAIVVFALQNIAAAGFINATQRLGARLEQAKLLPASRARLERILAERLPPEFGERPPIR